MSGSPRIVSVKALPKGDPLKTIGEDVGVGVTYIVQYLATFFPNEHINQLMTQVWHLIGTGVTPVAVGDVTTSIIGQMQYEGATHVVIIVPLNWTSMAAEDPIMAAGSMIFCGSLAVDYYNGLLLTNVEECNKRARAYEAEAMLAYKTTNPTWEPNEYHQSILAQYPDGIDTVGVERYTWKPLEKESAPIIFAEA